MIATQVTLGRPDELAVRWDDGHESVISLRRLRDECPCAGCQGETILFKTYAPAPQPDRPGKYQLAGAQPVGRYALKFTWGDGHDTGLYTWETLRSLCECAVCRDVERV